MEPSQASFSRIRRTFFPIHNHELMKFFFLSCLFFGITAAYGTLRGMKDIYIIKLGGPELIAAIKLLGVIPSMIVFKITFDTLSKRVGRRGRFNTIVGYFTIFFILSLFVLLPYREVLEITGFAKKMGDIYIIGRFGGVWLMIERWPVVLFYIHAEAFGSFVLSVLFWGLNNEITPLEQAKRFYVLLMLSAAVATSLSGVLLLNVGIFSMENLLQMVLVACVFLLIVYNIFDRAMKQNPENYQLEGGGRKKKKKTKLSFLESLKRLWKDPYLFNITFIVIGYALTINLFEAVYRDLLRELTRGNDELLRKFVGSQLVFIGIASIVMMLGVSIFKVMQRRWRFAASLMPWLMTLSTIIFFSFLFFGKYVMPQLEVKYLLLITVNSGLVFVVILKGGKYILFDPPKEMLFLVPKDPEININGKSAIDGVCSRLGKGLGSFLIAIFIEPVFGGVAFARPVLGVIILVSALLWLGSVNRLSPRFEAYAKEREEDQELQD